MPTGAPPSGRASIQDLQPLGSSRQSSIRIVVSQLAAARPCPPSAIKCRKTRSPTSVCGQLSDAAAARPRRRKIWVPSTNPSRFDPRLRLGRTDEICRYLSDGYGREPELTRAAWRRGWESQHSRIPRPPLTGWSCCLVAISHSSDDPGQTGLPDRSRDLFRSHGRQPVLRHQLQVVFARRNEDVDRSVPSGCVPPCITFEGCTQTSPACIRNVSPPHLCSSSLPA